MLAWIKKRLTSPTHSEKQMKNSAPELSAQQIETLPILQSADHASIIPHSDVQALTLLSQSLPQTMKLVNPILEEGEWMTARQMAERFDISVNTARNKGAKYHLDKRQGEDGVEFLLPKWRVKGWDEAADIAPLAFWRHFNERARSSSEIIDLPPETVTTSTPAPLRVIEGGIKKGARASTTWMTSTGIAKEVGVSQSRIGYHVTKLGWRRRVTERKGRLVRYQYLVPSDGIEILKQRLEKWIRREPEGPSQTSLKTKPETEQSCQHLEAWIPRDRDGEIDFDELRLSAIEEKANADRHYHKFKRLIEVFPEHMRFREEREATLSAKDINRRRRAAIKKSAA